MSWSLWLLIAFTASAGLLTPLGLWFDVFYEQEERGLRTPLEP